MYQSYSAAPRAGKVGCRGSMKDHPCQHRAQVHELRHGRGRVLVRVAPDETTPLYRVEWPDIGLSQPVNLTRAKDAARLWAELKVLIDLRKRGAERALKSLNNFSWSSSPVQKKRGGLGMGIGQTRNAGYAPWAEAGVSQ